MAASGKCLLLNCMDLTRYKSTSSIASIESYYSHRKFPIPNPKNKERKTVTMVTSPKAIFLFASTLCFVSLLGLAHAQSEQFTVVGRVYCDNCRAQFVTKISKYMAGAKVRLECKDREGGQMTHSIEGETDETGTYRIKVGGDHEEEVCEVILEKSADPECSEIDSSDFLRKSARISLAKDSGITSDIRLANPLGFMVKERLPECTEVLRELGITESGLV